MVQWRPIGPCRTNTPKRCIFHHRRQECKSRKSKDTRSNKQICPRSTKWSRAKTNRILPREHTGHSKHPLQHKRQDSTHGHHQMVNTEIRFDYILCNQRWRSSIQSAKARLGVDYGSDHESLIANFRFKLKKVGKTTTTRYDLNEIPYGYTVEVTNRFKGLDLIECLMNCGRRFVTLCTRQWSRPSPRKINA